MAVETAYGFEDRGPAIRSRPSRSAGIRPAAIRIRGRPRRSAASRSIGCHLGCRWTRRRPPSTPIATAVGRPIDDCNRERPHQSPKYRTTGEVRRAAMEAALSAD